MTAPHAHTAATMPRHHRAAPPLGAQLAPAAPVDAFRADVLRGLSARPRSLPSKHFYDERGSQLFEAICALPEYYPTRTELAIMRTHVDDMAARLGPACRVVEYGSGASVKTRLLLDALDAPAGYVPLDISSAALDAAAESIVRDYPGLAVRPVCADFTADAALPPTPEGAARTVVYFPGSTIGNFTPHEAWSFLRRITGVCGPDGAALIGVDLAKPRDILEPAYNDAEGVTADFNRNLLVRANRELGADFALDRFLHCAFFNARASRIEMHLESVERQTVHIGRRRFEFAPAERVRTEYSYKYTPGRFARLAASAGLQTECTWTDERAYFAVMLLRPSR